MCTLKSYFSCFASGRSNNYYLSLQDIPVSGYSHTARVMFDNGSEVTLITHVFARKAKLSYKDASYSIAGIGNESTVCDNGKV